MVHVMADKNNDDVIMSIIEKQKLINEYTESMRDNFFWSNELELRFSPKRKDVPYKAWVELPQYPNTAKWADKLFAKTIPSSPHESGHKGLLSAIVSAVITKTNDSQEIMNKAERLANLEWQLLQLTYWSAPTHEPNIRRNTFEELNRQRTLLRDCAIEALCLYRCGAHDFLNDFERYSSSSVSDIYCAEKFKSAFNKTMVLATSYSSRFDTSEKNAGNRSGQTIKNERLSSWIKAKLPEKLTAQKMWESICDEYGQTELTGGWYMNRGYKDDKELLFIYNHEGIPQSETGFDAFANFLTKCKKS